MCFSLMSSTGSQIATHERIDEIVRDVATMIRDGLETLKSNVDQSRFKEEIIDCKIIHSHSCSFTSFPHHAHT